ncbi:hypothetical protein ACWIDS_12315 [Dietzia maris]
MAPAFEEGRKLVVVVIAVIVGADSWPRRPLTWGALRTLRRAPQVGGLRGPRLSSGSGSGSALRWRRCGGSGAETSGAEVSGG